MPPLYKITDTCHDITFEHRALLSKISTEFVKKWEHKIKKDLINQRIQKKAIYWWANPNSRLK